VCRQIECIYVADVCYLPPYTQPTFVNQIRLFKNYPNPAKAEAMPNFENELTLSIIKKLMMPRGRNEGSHSNDFFLPI
jgi:hypothetical protein